MNSVVQSIDESLEKLRAMVLNDAAAFLPASKEVLIAVGEALQKASAAALDLEHSLAGLQVTVNQQAAELGRLKRQVASYTESGSAVASLQERIKAKDEELRILRDKFQRADAFVRRFKNEVDQYVEVTKT